MTLNKKQILVIGVLTAIVGGTLLFLYSRDKQLKATTEEDRQAMANMEITFDN